MNEQKNWYESKGVVGPIAALAATLIKQVADKLGMSVDHEQLTDGIFQIIIVGGICFGIWGRWHATQSIKPVRIRRNKDSGQ